MTDDSAKKLKEPLEKASSEVRIIVNKVLQLEKDNIFSKKPRGVLDDVIRIIKETVK